MEATKWISKLINAVLSALKRKEILIQAATWRNLEDGYYAKWNTQSQNNNVEFYLSELLREAKFTKRMLPAKDWRSGIRKAV